jgi:hypothetical protein
MVHAFTHLMKSNGGEPVSEIGRVADRERCAAPLGRKDGGSVDRGGQ